MRAILFSGAIALVLSLVGTRFAIRQFVRMGYGQPIREDGPTTHHTKRGTPTMGGVVIVISAVIAYFASSAIEQTKPSASALLLLFLFVGMGLVGFLDDFLKVRRQHNLGLRSRAKMIGQTIVAVVFGVLALMPGLADDRGVRPAAFYISTIHNFGPKLWMPLVIIVIWLWVTGFSNAVNLTDGLDGLATGASIMVFAAYTLVEIWQNNQRCGRVGIDPNHCYSVRDPLDLAIVAAAITGACFGFLWWNASPAKIIMGDTGSLALGGALAGLAVLSRTELLLVILGGLFVVITLSVMIQVSYFKFSRRVWGQPRRVFRMTPLQHHFEMLGWEQVTITIRFWLIAGIFAAVGMGIFYGAWVAKN